VPRMLYSTRRATGVPVRGAGGGGMGTPGRPAHTSIPVLGAVDGVRAGVGVGVARWGGGEGEGGGGEGWATRRAAVSNWINAAAEGGSLGGSGAGGGGGGEGAATGAATATEGADSGIGVEGAT
jgi:hypothetical protein